MKLNDDHNKFTRLQKEARELRWKKLNDYGRTYSDFGFIGILVKLGDKYNRIKRLHMNKQIPNNESVRDSLIDLANYAIMGIMVLEEKNAQNKRKTRK